MHFATGIGLKKLNQSIYLRGHFLDYGGLEVLSSQELRKNDDFIKGF